MTRIFHWFFCERWIPCQASTSVLCLHYRPETVHWKWSTKDAYTSETTFLALQPCILVRWFNAARWEGRGRGGMKIEGGEGRREGVRRVCGVWWKLVGCEGANDAVCQHFIEFCGAHNQIIWEDILDFCKYSCPTPSMWSGRGGERT